MISWVGTASSDTYNTSTDGGPWHWENHQMLWATYFFMSDERVDHSQNVYNIFSVLSSVGGIMSLLLGFLTNIFIVVNRKFIIAKLIRSLYFKGGSNDEPDDPDAMFDDT